MFKRIKKIYRFCVPFLDKINHDNVFAIAGQSAFFLILSSVPLTMFAVSVLQNLHIPVDILEQVFGVILSERATEYVSTFLSNVYENTVSISFITLIVTLWSAAQGFHAITNGLNRIHDTYENRNWLFLRLRAMIYTVVFFVIIIASMLVIVLGSSINSWLSPHIVHLPDMVGVMYNLRYVLVFFYLVILFALLYRNIPNIPRELRGEYGFKYQLPGAALCATSWVVLSFGISIYVDDFNGFSIYGGLTRLAMMMVWLYFCMVFLMFGAEVNYVYHDKIKSIKFFRKRKK